MFCSGYYVNILRADILDNIHIWVGDEITRGRIVFDSLEPSLISDLGKRLGKNRQDVFYKFDYEIKTDKNGTQFYTKLQNSVIIQLNPKLVITRSYSENAVELLGDIHPPSSKGWYGRMIRGTRDVIYIIQELRNGNQFWMTILDPDDKTVLECHSVQRYEIDILHLVDIFEHFDSLVRFFGEGTYPDVRERILKVLDETTLSWQDIYNLSHGMGIPSSLPFLHGL